VRKSSYLSCNCFQCRHASPKVKREAKRAAHRKLRRAVRAALRRGEAPPDSVAAGYRA